MYYVSCSTLSLVIPSFHLPQRISKYPLCFFPPLTFSLALGQEDEFAGLSRSSEVDKKMIDRVDLSPDTFIVPHTAASELSQNLREHVPEVLVRYCGS